MKIGLAVRAKLCQSVPVSKQDNLNRLKAKKQARFAAPVPSNRVRKKGGHHEVTAPLPQPVHERKSEFLDMERVALNGERTAAESSGPTNSNRGGRPLARDADKALSRTKPWEKLGMSRRTWYRRRNKK